MVHATSRHRLEWRDVSLPLEESTPVYPGDPPLRVHALHDHDRGDGFRLSAISLSAHLGTHVDAPWHYLPNGRSLEEMGLQALLGHARVIEVLTTGGISAAMLEDQIPPTCERVLLKTSRAIGPYPRPSAWLEPEGAHLLAGRGLQLVGIDSLSVDPVSPPAAEAHRILLEQGVVIVENLVLQEEAPGEVEFICLPLRLLGVEGAPARAILRRIS